MTMECGNLAEQWLLSHQNQAFRLELLREHLSDQTYLPAWATACAVRPEEAG